MVSELETPEERSGLEPWPGHCVVCLSPKQVCRWVQANLILEVTLRWTSIPSRDSSSLHAVETGIRLRLMGHNCLVCRLYRLPICLEQIKEYWAITMRQPLIILRPLAESRWLHQTSNCARRKSLFFFGAVGARCKWFRLLDHCSQYLYSVLFQWTVLDCQMKTSTIHLQITMTVTILIRITDPN